MVTTPNGTVYNFTTATITGLGRVRWTIADDRKTDLSIPTIVYAHGANGALGSFAGGSTWAPLRNWLMDNGWLVIEGEGGTFDSTGTTFNHWGNTMNRQAYRAYLDHVAGLLDIGPLFAMGSSMGGLITKWLATRSDIAADFRGLLSFAGVGTITVGNYDTVPGTTPTNIGQRTGRYFGASILDAYGVSSYEELEVAAADHAPENWPASVWEGKRILEMYGDADIAVPWYPRGSAALRTIRAGLPAVDIAELHPGVDHALAGAAGAHLSVVTDFLTASLPAPDVPGTAFITDELYVALAGELLPVRFGA